MTPDVNCTLDVKYRMLFAIVLEHIGLFVVVVVTTMIDPLPVEVRANRETDGLQISAPATINYMQNSMYF